MKIENDLLLRTANGEQVERPPVWLMRQAGRILPQYRALRGRLSGFKELVETPQLAAEVTIQPVDELGVDAAIIFSDILVIPEAMGLTYEMVEKKGPWFPKTIESLSDVEKLGVGENVLGELQYVFDALEVTKKELNGRVPLIGFAGAPWTIFSYMLEGSGSKTFSKARKFLYQNPKAAHLLLDKITQTTIAYLRQKVHSGANMIQVFDSWAGILPPHQYSEFAIPYIKKIVDAIEGVPVIVFAKGAWFAMEEISKLDCQVLGVDWNTKVGDLRDKLNVQQVLQGNLDPCMLYSSQENIQTATLKMLKEFGVGHIANLGHGVYPDTPLDNVKVFVNTVKGFSY
ncbi:uroporphyrinogen decarboxylase [Saprospiraceae bacterium]|nr:uroporphyrinogen decarboxylase [Saprospiraceae bacterium]